MILMTFENQGVSNTFAITERGIKSSADRLLAYSSEGI